MAEYQEKQFLQKGQIVKIYKDPVTKQDLECEGLLEKFEYNCGSGQRWKVRLIADLQIVSRLIEPPFMVKVSDDEEDKWTTKHSENSSKKKSRRK